MWLGSNYAFKARMPPLATTITLQNTVYTFVFTIYTWNICLYYSSFSKCICIDYPELSSLSLNSPMQLSLLTTPPPLLPPINFTHNPPVGCHSCVWKSSITPPLSCLTAANFLLILFPSATLVAALVALLVYLFFIRASVAAVSLISCVFFFSGNLDRHVPCPGEVMLSKFCVRPFVAFCTERKRFWVQRHLGSATLSLT